MSWDQNSLGQHSISSYMGGLTLSHLNLPATHTAQWGLPGALHSALSYHHSIANLSTQGHFHLLLCPGPPVTSNGLCCHLQAITLPQYSGSLVNLEQDNRVLKILRCPSLSDQWVTLLHHDMCVFLLCQEARTLQHLWNIILHIACKDLLLTHITVTYGYRPARTTDSFRPFNDQHTSFDKHWSGWK